MCAVLFKQTPTSPLPFLLLFPHNSCVLLFGSIEPTYCCQHVCEHRAIYSIMVISQGLIPEGRIESVFLLSAHKSTILPQLGLGFLITSFLHAGILSVVVLCYHNHFEFISIGRHCLLCSSPSLGLTNFLLSSMIPEPWENGVWDRCPICFKVFFKAVWVRLIIVFLSWLCYVLYLGGRLLIVSLILSQYSCYWFIRRHCFCVLVL